MKLKHQKKAQQIQDKMFGEMSADQKIKLASGMWLLANKLTKDNNGQKHRSKRSTSRHRKNS